MARSAKPVRSRSRGSALPTLLLGMVGGALIMLGLACRMGMWTLPEVLQLDSPGDIVGLPESIQVAADLLGPPPPSKLIYLNREGAQLQAGPDDATINMSSISSERFKKSSACFIATRLTLPFVFSPPWHLWQ